MRARVKCIYLPTFYDGSPGKASSEQPDHCDKLATSAFRNPLAGGGPGGNSLHAPEGSLSAKPAERRAG